jgi:hypothetical protein
MIFKALMWQAGEAKACVANPDPAVVVGQDLCSDVDQATLLGLYHASSFSVAVDED